MIKVGSSFGARELFTRLAKLLNATVLASFGLLGAANGKVLIGAAKTSFLQKGRREPCEPKAVDKNGKALTGAAKKTFLQKVRGRSLVVAWRA